MEKIKNFGKKHWGKLVAAVVLLGILAIGSCGTLVVAAGLGGAYYLSSAPAEEAPEAPVAVESEEKMPASCEASVETVRLTWAKDNGDGLYEIGMPQSFAGCYVSHKAGKLTAWDASTGGLVTCSAPLSSVGGLVTVSNCAPTTTAKGGAPQPPPDE